MTDKVTMEIYRGENGTGEMVSYEVESDTGLVVLDVVHRVQAEHAPDLACRWNCKAGKCGSCSAEVNGKPTLMCMKRMDTLPTDRPVSVRPLQTFPHQKDLVCDVSWNYEVNKRIPPFKMRKDQDRTLYQEDVDRVQEFRKCIECFLCQDVCHVLRDHQMHDRFVGPRHFVYVAALQMHPLDTENRLDELKNRDGIGFCNITKCCTKVCPESITITDNAIIPLKERVVDQAYDPLRRLLRVVSSRR